MRKIYRALFGYLVSGILYAVPVTVIVYACLELFGFIDGLLPFDRPGVGIAVLLLLLIVVGYLGSTIIAQRFKFLFNRILDRIPILKTAYLAIKDLIAVFVGQKKSFNTPVLVKLNQQTEIEKLGFITQKDLGKLGIGADKVAVYMPHSYNFSGNLFIVPVKNITLVDAKPADIMKFIVSGGVTEIEEK